MTDNDFVSTLNDSIRQELNSVADEEIEKLVDKFRCELGKHRAIIIGNLIDNIEFSFSRDTVSDNTVFQINIRGVSNG